MLDSAYFADWNNAILATDTTGNLGQQPAEPQFLVPELCELVANICDELSLSLEVECTCLDNFERFARQRYARMLATSAAASQALPPPPPSTAAQQQQQLATADAAMAASWRREMQRFVQDAPIYAVAVLLLATKQVGSGQRRQMRLQAVCCLMRSIRPAVTVEQLKRMEAEVFTSLDFTIRPSLMWRALELFLVHSDQSTSHHHHHHHSPTTSTTAFVHCKAAQILRIVYCCRPLIRQLFAARFPALDASLLRDHCSAGQRGLCLVAATVVAAHHFARQPAELGARVAQRLAAAAALPERQLRQLALVVADVVQRPEARPLLGSCQQQRGW